VSLLPQHGVATVGAVVPVAAAAAAATWSAWGL